jgi:hypothetical protein
MVRIARCVVLAVLVSGTMLVELHAQPTPQADAEPNGTAATANQLTMAGGRAFVAGVITSGDLDFFRFTASAGSRIWILSDTGGPQGGGATSRDTVIDLLAADGTTVIENDDDDGTGNGGDGTIETGLSSTIAGRTLMAGGTYFIRVRAFSPTGVINPYRLMATVTSSAAAEVEPNNASGEANPITSVVGLRTGSISVAGDTDFYSIFVAAGEILLIAADGDPERDGTGTDLVVELRDPAAALLLSIDSSITGSLANPAAETGNFTILTAGTYSVRVRHFSAAGTGTYDLMLARIQGSSRPLFDFDGDLRSDIGIYRGSTGDWIILSSLGSTAVQVNWGCPACGDISVPGDYDGDARADIAVYRNSTGEWFVLNSATNTLTTVSWGAPPLGDIPVPADYDGDGKTDLAIYRNSTGEWIMLNSATSTSTTVGWGAPALGDKPVPADYDGDGKADIAVYRNSTGEWFVLNSATNTLTTVSWGAPALDDSPVPADYDGDRKADIAVYRNSTGEWFVLNSATSTLTTLSWGAPPLGDIPVPADYDGDGKTDVGVYRNSTGEWIMLNSATSTSTTVSWGAPPLGDIPLSRPQARR